MQSIHIYIYLGPQGIYIALFNFDFQFEMSELSDCLKLDKQWAGARTRVKVKNLELDDLNSGRGRGRGRETMYSVQKNTCCSCRGARLHIFGGTRPFWSIPK